MCLRMIFRTTFRTRTLRTRTDPAPRRERRSPRSHHQHVVPPHHQRRNLLPRPPHPKSRHPKRRSAQDRTARTATTCPRPASLRDLEVLYQSHFLFRAFSEYLWLVRLDTDLLHVYLLDEVAIDTGNIITGGRRTRGAKVDYTKFGMDRSEDED